MTDLAGRWMVLVVGLAALVPLPLTPRADAATWPEIRNTYKPWTRWWWPGSAVDRHNIERNLRQLHDAGFGGVEVTAIYGVKGQESKYIQYLSPEWVTMLRFAAETAHRLGMGLDMPLGSGWRTGGPFVDETDANSSMKFTRVPLRSGQLHRENFHDRAVGVVVACPDNGAPVDLTADIGADGGFAWTAPAGKWTLYIVETVWSGGKVKRAAPGGEGYSVDVYSRDAVEGFFRNYRERIRSLPPGTLRSWFHDSFEYRGNWTRAFFGEFVRRRGYDLKLHLPALLAEDNTDEAVRVRSDYRETISDLLLENFIEPLNQWAHSVRGLSRNQAHGSPGNLLDLYAASDIPETEAFGRRESNESYPLIGKFASSAAHVMGKPLASSESFTWLDDHFTVTLDEMKQATDEFLLAGINHMFFHGTCYSPSGARWPGWLFYAATEANPRNPFWRDLPALNRYITRAQSILQGGQPSAGVLLYWPWYDVLDNDEKLFQQLEISRTNWFFGEAIAPLAKSLWAKGFAFDYISDRMLDNVTVPGGRLQAPGGPYQVVLVPQTQRMPLPTFRRLVHLAESGATIIFDRRLPEDVPGWGRLEKRHAEFTGLKGQLRFERTRSGNERAEVGRGAFLVSTNVALALAEAGVRRESAADHGLSFVRRARESGYDYFLKNAAAGNFDGWLSLATPAASVLLMDPMSGQTGLADLRHDAKGAPEVRLQLPPGNTVILRTFAKSGVKAKKWPYLLAAGEPIPLRGEWRVRFMEGGPNIPDEYATRELASWTGRGGEAERFAGTARYTLVFDDLAGAPNYLLDLGRVADSARVLLNGWALGTLIGHPFRIATGQLKPRANRLDIEVTNLAANRIRDLDRRGVPWKIFHDINFVNIDYEPFDASGWPIRESGLLGPVRLVPFE